MRKSTGLLLRFYLFRKEYGTKNILQSAKTGHSIFICNFSEKKTDSENILNLGGLTNFQNYSIKFKKQKKGFIKFTLQKGEVWYEKYISLIGLDKVKRMQDQVQQFEEELLKAQKHRREIHTQLMLKQNERQKIEQSLLSLNKIEDNDKYMKLIILESEAIQVEKQFNQLFKDADQKERELFTQYCKSTRDSHKVENLLNEKVRYIGFVISLGSMVLGAILTILVNRLRNYELEQGIQKGVGTKIDSINKNIHNIETKFICLDDKLSHAFKKNSQSSWSYWDYVSWVPRTTSAVASKSVKAVKSLFGY